MTSYEVLRKPSATSNPAKPTSKKSPDPRWLRYEKEVYQLVKDGDPAAKVEHNQRVHGQLSGKMRQIDVRATGKLAGSEILIIVECKRRKAPVGIGVIDEFIGKLLDVRADQGILFSFTGFTEPAIARADAASHPKVGLVILGEPEKKIDEFVPSSAVYAREDATYDAMRESPYEHPSQRRRRATEDYREFMENEDVSLVRYAY
ncbi:restriction endonuclease [Thermomonospora echinospora]|uniref:restriction endonuclease n=1 Tax=Thermomonospora echinospora TaxID=1992 RepID=UPI0011B0E4BA|nr:restriction endonuclease [Thermomonospora echinospora]